VRGWVQEEVLGLNISVADTQAVDMSEGTSELIDVEFHVEEGDGLLGFLMLSRDGVDGFGDVFKD